MSNEDRLSTWIGFQKKTWQGDQGSIAKTIVVKRRNTDDIIFTGPVDSPDLAEMIKTSLTMQGEELPKGSHAFLCVALDEKGVQLSELPQSVRGTNKDATNAAQEQIAMQNAAAKALGNLDFANHALTRQLGQIHEKLSSEVEDKFALLESLVESKGQNFEAQLMLERFNRNQARLDVLIDNLAPAVGILASWATEKLVNANPDLKKAFANVGSATTQKPVDSTSSSVPVTGQEPVQTNASSGSKGNGRLIPA